MNIYPIGVEVVLQAICIFVRVHPYVMDAVLCCPYQFVCLAPTLKIYHMNMHRMNHA